MPRLTEKKRGYYDKEEADKFIAALKNDYETRLAEQKERIFAQAEDLNKLSATLADYKKREDYIGRAITEALQKADQIEAAARGKYEEEVIKLQNFHKKFADYYDNITAFYPLDGELRSVGNFIGKADAVIKQKADGLNFTDGEQNAFVNYEQNAARLKRTGWQIKPIEEQINNISAAEKSKRVFDKYTADADETAAEVYGRLQPVSQMKKYLNRPAAAEPRPVPPHAVDLDEVLKPTQSLEDLCAELGLISK